MPHRSLQVAICVVGTLIVSACAAHPDSSATPPRPLVTVPEEPAGDRWNMLRGRYNRVYASPDQTIFVATPSDFLMDCVRDQSRHRADGAPRTAVDLGAGQGRNSLALAEAGYTVVAIDLSAVGLAQLRAAAASRHLIIETIEADVYAVTFEPEAFDLVAAIYFRMTDDLFARLQSAIKPGGAIVVDAYPGDAQPGDLPLPERFPGWRIAQYETVEIMPDWYWQGERRPAQVVRFFAYKPVQR